MKQSSEIKVPEFLKKEETDNYSYVKKVENGTNPVTMNQTEKEKLVDLISAMDDAQIEIVLSCISTDKMLEHIRKELNKNKEFIKAITQANDILQ